MPVRGGGRRLGTSLFYCLPDPVQDDLDIFGPHHRGILGELAFDIAGLRGAGAAVLVQPRDHRHHAPELRTLDHYVGIGDFKGLGELGMFDAQCRDGAGRPARPADDHEENIRGRHLGNQRRVDCDGACNRSGSLLTSVEKALPRGYTGQQDDADENQRHGEFFVHGGIIADVRNGDNVFTCVRTIR